MQLIKGFRLKIFLLGFIVSQKYEVKQSAFISTVTHWISVHFYRATTKRSVFTKNPISNMATFSACASGSKNQTSTTLENVLIKNFYLNG